MTGWWMWDTINISGLIMAIMSSPGEKESTSMASRISGVLLSEGCLNSMASRRILSFTLKNANGDTAEITIYLKKSFGGYTNGT